MKDSNKPVYIISVAAEILSSHPQTLRFYERKGLIKPHRVGKNRLYSDNDIDKIKFIQQLTQEMGVNLAGVEIITKLQNELELLKRIVENFDNNQIPKDIF